MPTDQATRDVARELGDRGVEAYGKGDWEQARQLFHQAFQLVPAPTLAIREADALVKLGRLVEAREGYARVALAPVGDDSPIAFHQAVKRAAAELRDLDLLVPRLTVTLRPGTQSGARVLIDGKVMDESEQGLGQMIDPGKHHIEIVDETGRVVFERGVELAPGQHATVFAAPEALDSPRSSARETLGWTSIAIGGAGVALGITTALLAAQHKDNLDKQCTLDICPSSAQGDLDAYRSLRSASFVGYGIGLAGVGLGTTILLTGGKDGSANSESAGIRPWFGLSSAGLGGRF